MAYLEDNVDRRWKRPPVADVGGTGSAHWIYVFGKEKRVKKQPIGFAPPKRKRAR